MSGPARAESASMRRVVVAALFVLASSCLASTLALAAETGAAGEVPTAESAAGESRGAAATADSSGHQIRRRIPRQSIDDSVRRLTRTLDLDASQQATLKELLERQQRDIRRIWAQASAPNADRVGPTLAILDRTRDQIRAMLNEDQQRKYPAAVPRDATGSGQADVEYWTRLTQTQAQHDANQAN